MPSFCESRCFVAMRPSRSVCRYDFSEQTRFLRSLFVEKQFALSAVYMFEGEWLRLLNERVEWLLPFRVVPIVFGIKGA